MSDNGKVFPYPLPVVVATGECGTGKTLLGLTTGYPLERVCVYDNEQSATVYESMGPFARVDLLTELGQKHPGGWTNLLCLPRPPCLHRSLCLPRFRAATGGRPYMRRFRRGRPL